MSESYKNVLIDVRELLRATQWGGKAIVDQCPYCGKRRDTFPADKHRGGCKYKSHMRRIDAVLRIEGE